MKIASEQEMLTFGEQFAKQLGHGISSTHSAQIIELVGDVGAGKTTFVRGLANGLGVKNAVTSPSFTISKSYVCNNGQTLIHYDFYRLKDPGLMANDLKEKLTDNNIILVEWGNSIKNILPSNRIVIEITKNDDGSRDINIKDCRKEPTDILLNTQISKQPTSFHKHNNKNKYQDGTLHLFLDTSTKTTVLKLNDKTYTWESGHDLAEKLLEFIHEKLQENHKDWKDISEITFMSGPGSFTGLRIGATVVNTLASELNIPLKNHKNESVKIILPDYGRDANIGKPQK